MLNTLQSHLARGARRAAWASAGALLLLVGAGFLTVTAWLVLSSLRDAQFAALVIGLFYVGAGLIALAMGARRPPPVTPRPDPCQMQQDLFERIAIAFSEGFQAGKAMRR
ncbi:phage holin family protein [Celeribacter persicus]|uniref:Putative superfamily III holin-X n=1 Tax=Celeribacter persicus TaxID=1651082 RepID=A0A2T5HTL5_9RHOB|nr:phage holin family protein [Celeribacter persicus]PTQ74924.1 putative superfamily III holin-X [Celeribacter persicus]